MQSAFNGTTNLRIPATDAPDLSNVTRMDSMFFGASAFNDPINHWDVSNITHMNNMFGVASTFNQPLDNWDVSNVTVMERMFQGNTAFNQSLSSWDISSIADISNIFRNHRALSTQNQDAILASWASQAVDKNITGIPLHIGLKSYSSVGADAIGVLQGLGWTITEQYSASYNVSLPATLSGVAFQVRNSGQSTTPVTINFPEHCSFVEWSDGNASTTRSDVLTDNL